MRVQQALLRCDARYFQLAALGVLLLLSNFWSDFGSGLFSFAAAMAGCQIAQWVGGRWHGASYDWRSAAITAFSLSLLMRAPHIGWFFAAGVLAMLLKAFVRVRGKHVFNPANGAIVALLFLAPVWIVPGQWGQIAWVLGLMIGFAALVLSRARRVDIALAFLCCYAACLFGRALWLGDPMAIPVHQLQNGSIIVFTCFMITDPRSTANSRTGRVMFAALVAITAMVLQIKFQLVGSPLYALALLSLMTPLIDHFWRDERFRWRAKEGQDHAALV